MHYRGVQTVRVTIGGASRVMVKETIAYRTVEVKKKYNDDDDDDDGGHCPL